MSLNNDETCDLPNDPHEEIAVTGELSDAPPDRHHQGTTGTTTHPKPIASERYDDVKGNSIDIDSDGGDNIEEENEDEDDELEEIVPQRKKRIRRVYNGMIECNVEPIRSLLTCTLCEGLYREPYTTLKCFHTFCKSCLITAIRASYNTPQYNCCPICQTYFGRDDIVTNNALPDRVLETLIDKVLFPHLSYQDHILECEFYRKRNIPRKENISSTTQTTKGSVREKPKGHDTTAYTNVDSNTQENNKNHTKEVKQQHPPPKTIILNDDKDQMITFQLVPHPVTTGPTDPQIPSLPLPFFQTSAQIRIHQIKKLLSLKLFPDSMRNSPGSDNRQPNHRETHNDSFDIYCNGCVLEDELSLNFIFHVIWGVDTNKKNDSNGPSKNSKSTITERTSTLTLEYKYVAHQDDGSGTDIWK